MALEESNVIPIIKLSNNSGAYYPLSVPESVYSTHEYEVSHDIGNYKKGDVIDKLTTVDVIIENILGGEVELNSANFVGTVVTDPGSNDGRPDKIEKDDGSFYYKSQYRQGDIVIYANPSESSNVLCIFYKKASEEEGKWLTISDDLIYVGSTPPPTKSERKVLWLDTSTKTIDSLTDTPELDSLKNLVYKLMMAYNKVVKLVENGVKPTDASGVVAGTEVSNWRKELITAADPLMPADIPVSTELSAIDIYGNDYTGDGSQYRALFTPSGFHDKQVYWKFTSAYEGNDKKTALKNEDNEVVAFAEIITEAAETLEKPLCSLKLYMVDGTPIIYDDIVDVAIEINAVYNIEPYIGDKKIIASKTIKIGGEKPESDVEPTVKSVCIKMDTSENFAAHKDDLIDGELLFYTDKAKFVVYRCFKNDKGVSVQKFYALQTDESEGKGLTEDQLYTLALNYLQFKDDTGNVFKVHVDTSGSWKLTKKDSIYASNGSDGGYAAAGSKSRYLSMSVIYCGGNSNTEGKASHNFVEICNSRLDGGSFNLSGMFLMHTNCEKYPASEGFVWDVLRLEGSVSAGSTFTVRGARSNRDDASFIRVDNFDQEWYQDGKLVEFDVNKGAFFLINGENVDGERVLPLAIREALANHTFTGFSSDSLPDGYVDGFGFRNLKTLTNIPCEKNPLDISPDSVTSADDPNIVTADQCIFTKNFILDPSSQALKVYTSKDTTALWTFIKFDKQTEKLGNSEQYYWTDSYKKSYTPGSVSDKHDFYFYGRSKFNDKKPNCINITFGKQATATVNYNDPVLHEMVNYYPITEDSVLKSQAALDGVAYTELFVETDVVASAVYTTKKKYAKYTANSDAARCFNWISVGNFNEYIEFRKKGDTEWNRQYSIIYKDKNDPDSMILKDGSYVDAPFIEFYKRYTWATGYDNVWVTSHKRIIRGLSDGTYEYRIGRDDDDSYTTPINTFVVKNDAQVIDFKFIQVTDQQGFNWSEYQAWKRACYMINKNRSVDNFDFSVNTGDIGQSGNRVSEFIDYFNGRSPISDIPEMFTIGNNDLCSRNPTEFGNGTDRDCKYNHVNVRKYYTFELDDRIVDEDDNSLYYLPSLEVPMDLDGTKFKTFYNIPIESLYSYNYGNYHFISLNSEYTAASIIMYNKLKYDETAIKTIYATRLVNTINARIEKWLKKDLLLWKPNSYPATTDIKYMAGRKYYWYRNEFGEVTSTISQMVAGTNYRCSTDPDHPSTGSDNIGQVYFKNSSTGTMEEHTISSSDILVNEPYECSKCLVYMHEIPFTIVTDKFILDNSERAGSKLNTNNNYGNYRFSRLFSKYGIRIVFGGHKHTYCISRPTVDAPLDYLKNGSIYTDYTDSAAGTSITAALSRSPVIQFNNIGDFATIIDANTVIATLTDKTVVMHLTDSCTHESTLYTEGYYLYIKNGWQKLTATTDSGHTYYTLDIENQGTGLTARCEFVTDNKFTLPTYVMSQATGFKLVSNKELMTCNKNVVPWLRTFCPESNADTVTEGFKPGRNQLDPMYIVFNLDSDTNKANIKMMVVKNIYTVKESSGSYKATCLMNKQNATLSNDLLFEQTLENI